LFGEAALLSDAPRDAMVRALEDTELLVLRRGDLLEAMHSSRDLAGEILGLMRLRARPRRLPGVAVAERKDAAGETITILSDSPRPAYFQLSPQGRFLWDRLDGRRTLRDLTVDYFYAFRAFSPQFVEETVSALETAGFLQTSPLRGDVPAAALPAAWWQRAAGGAGRVLEWRITARTVDGPLTWLYDAGLHLIFTAGWQAVLALVSLAGLAVFFLSADRAGAWLQSPPAAGLLAFLLPAWLLSMALHEAGHALTAKAVGCRVGGAGVGWYWFAPVAFVDTSDAWRADRRERIAVSIAGPYASVIAGSIASLCIGLAPGSAAVPLLWQLALMSYLVALVNFNPLLEYDGYYVLMDWLERPNLRSHALRWLGCGLPKALRGGAGLRSHCLELLYGAASLSYIALMCLFTVKLYRLLLQEWIGRVLSTAAASALAWAPALCIAILSVLSVPHEMYGRPVPAEKA